MGRSVNLLISDEEKERVWPWLDEVREDHAEATKEMTPSEQIAYYRAELKRLRKEQNYHPLVTKVGASYQWLLSIGANEM